MLLSFWERGFISLLQPSSWVICYEEDNGRCDYAHGSKRDPQKARGIAEALETYKRQLYRSLKSLQRKQERPARFSAVAFDKVLDQFSKANMEEADRVEENREKDSFRLTHHADRKF